MQQLKNLLGFCFLFFGSIVEIFRMWNKGIGSQRKKKKWNEIEKNIEQVVIGGIKNKKKKRLLVGVLIVMDSENLWGAKLRPRRVAWWTSGM